MITQSKRLLFRECTAADATFIRKLVNTPTWLEHIGDRNVHSDAAAVTFINDRLIKSYTTNGYGLWVVQLKSKDKLIGLFGFVKRDYLEHADIGFALLPEYAGMGYGKEAGIATMAYGVNQLKFKTIYGITSLTNSISQGLLKTLGLQELEVIVAPNEKEELMLFKL